MTELKQLPKQKFITCPECHTNILILPDVKAMGNAIHNHVKTHRTRTALQKAKIVNNLTQQALYTIAVSNATKLPTKVWLLIESYFGSKHVHGVALTEKDADNWTTLKYQENPQGSFFSEQSAIVPIGGA
jgi:hypothetical protein